MANERRDDEDQMAPSAEVEVRNDADIDLVDAEDLEKVKIDELMDDRFQATDN